MNQPIFILGAHKSGTSLMRSILDNHPELFVIPIETHVFKHLGAAIEYPLKKQDSKPFNGLIWKKDLSDWVIKCNANKQNSGGSFAMNSFDIEQFNTSLSEYELNDHWPTQIQNYFCSIVMSLNSTIDSKKIRMVEKSVEHMEFATELKSYFPDAKFIHVIRNPYSNLVSLRNYNYKITQTYPSLRTLALSIKDSLYFNEMNKRQIKDDYLTIQYEDLVSEPKKSVQHVVDFLGINDHDILNEPTILGKPWSGNSAKGKSFDRISNLGLHDWKQMINHLEVQLINKVCGSYLASLDYEPITRRGNLLPFKKESPKVYLYNRLSLYYTP